MSTKCTISHGKNFHFYSEACDEQNVYLQLDNLPYEVWSNHYCTPPFDTVVITIPLPIWEVIRQQTIASFDWADKTDEEILQYATETIDAKIAAYNNASNQEKKWRRFAKSDEPREERIEELVTHYTHLRECQQNLKSAIEQINKLNQPKTFHFDDPS